MKSVYKDIKQFLNNFQLELEVEQEIDTLQSKLEQLVVLCWKLNLVELVSNNLS